MNLIELKPGNVACDLNAPQPKPWLSFPGCQHLLPNKNQTNVSQIFSPNLHLVPQSDKKRQETVIMRYGYDMRQHFEKTEEYPWSTQVFLWMRFPSHDIDTHSQGSGTFIGPNTILTAAHNVRNIENGTQEDFKSIGITPAAHKKNAPFDIPGVKHVLISPYYNATNPNYQDHDWALIIIDRPTGNKTGWLGVACLTNEELKDRWINIVGYPTDKGQNKNRQLWGAGDVIKNIWRERFTYWIDTAGGQSGSGVWIWPHQNKEPYIVGIHILGPDKEKTPEDKWENEATRITPEKYQQLVLWIGKYAYKDPLYTSVEHWSNNFWDKDESKVDQTQLQIASHLWKRELRTKNPCFGRFIEQSLKSGLFSVFTSISISIQRLELVGLQIGNEWAKVLAENETWDCLMYLILDKNNIGDEGAEALAANKSWLLLKVLSLKENPISPRGAQALAKNETWLQLKYLIFDRERIRDGGNKAMEMDFTMDFDLFFHLKSPSQSSIGVSLKNKSLCIMPSVCPSLAISQKKRSSSLIPFCCPPIGAAPKNKPPSIKPSVYPLTIIQTMLIFPHEDSVAPTEYRDEIAENNLQQMITDCCAESDKKDIFIASFILPKIVTDNWLDKTLSNLSLIRQQITDEGAKVLATNKLWCLKTLMLSMNLIGDKGAESLASNTVWRLRVLDLSYNNLSDEGVIAIASNRVWPLVDLNLANNQIGVNGAWAIARNTQWSLQSLWLESSAFSQKKFKFFDRKIVRALKRRFGKKAIHFYNHNACDNVQCSRNIDLHLHLSPYL